MVLGLHASDLVDHVPQFVLEVVDTIVGLEQVSVLLLHLALDVLVLLEEALGANLELVVLLVHVVQGGLEVLDLLVVDLLDVRELLCLVRLEGLDLVGEAIVLLLELADAVDVPGQPVVQVLQGHLLLLAGEPAALGHVGVRVVVQPEFVEALRRFVLAGLLDRLNDSSDVFSRPLGLLWERRINLIRIVQKVDLRSVQYSGIGTGISLQYLFDLWLIVSIETETLMCCEHA